MKRSSLAFAASLCAIGSIAFAASHEAPPQIEARQGVMKTVGISMGVVGGMARGNTPYDAEAAQVAADNLVAISGLHLELLFPAETIGVDGTDALPPISEDWAGFQEKWDGFGTAVAAFQGVAGEGLDPMKVALGDVGKTCGACHDDYRKKQ